jgi:hypothetical protein
MYPIETKQQDTSVFRLAFVGISVVCLFFLTSIACAATDSTDKDGGYVDSVYSWGTWELDLEPASGPQLPANNAINDRSRKLQFRPNDNAAYITQSVPVPPISVITAPPPIPMPVIPATPIPVIPPTPIGPPGFTSGAPTTFDPRN